MAVCLVILGSTRGAISRPNFSLDGRWEFRFTPDDIGEQEGWYKSGKKFPLRLQVPGCWDAQGIGEETDKMRHHAIGMGWYRRTFGVPPKWRGKQIWLHFGGVHRSAKVWVNEQLVGEHWGYPVAFKFNITKFLQPSGGQSLVIAVDSRRHPELDPLTGTFDVIDYMDIDWGGIYEHVWLECTDQRWIEDVFVQPDPVNQLAKVKITLGKNEDVGSVPLTLWHSVHTWNKGRRPRIVLDAGRKNIAKDRQEVEFDLIMDQAPRWTPQTPNLLTLSLSLRQGDKLIDTHQVRFGLRRLEIRGADFYLNGERFFFRGYGDDFNFPIELVPPADVDYWRNYLQIRKSFGFNGVRHHSMMPTESYLAAADEVGILVQPELPIAYRKFYQKATPQGHDLYRYVWSQYIRQMRNHPSVFAWCMGNELWNGFSLGQELYKTAKELDPTRPVIDSDGLVRKPIVRPTIDYMSFLYQMEHTIPWGKNKNKYVFDSPPDIPLIAHEMSNLVVMRDPSKIARFTGAIKPFWYEEMRDKVKERQLERYLPAMIDASRRMQARLLKINFEGARLSPQIDGYHQWLFRDYWCQNSGFVDMFDDTRGMSPGLARRFNSEAVLLWDRERVSFSPGEPIDLKIYLSDFRSAKAPALQNVFVIVDGKTHFLKPPANAGRRGLVGPWTGKIKSPAVSVPQKYVVFAYAGSIKNDWPIWVFPHKSPAAAAKDGVLITSPLTEEALEKLANGGWVWVLDEWKAFPLIAAQFKNAWWRGRPDQKHRHCYGNMIMSHPALQDFPHDGYGDLQMFNLLDERPVALMDEFPVRIEPIVWCLDVPREMRRKAYLFEARVGKGKLLVSTMNFSQEIRETDPAAQYFYQCLKDYVNSDKFNPEKELPVGWLSQRVSTYRPPAKQTWVEGFSKVVESTEGAGQWVTYRQQQDTLYLVRQTDGKQKLRWLTAKVPKNWPHDTVTFVFGGGLGFRSQPGGGHFSLSVNGKPGLDFSLEPDKVRWKGPSGISELHFNVLKKTAEDNVGLFFLTVPIESVELGKEAEIMVTATAHNSRRWFAVNPYKDVVERERDNWP
jgi:hypothetical protein